MIPREKLWILATCVSSGLAILFAVLFIVQVTKKSPMELAIEQEGKRRGAEIFKAVGESLERDKSRK